MEHWLRLHTFADDTAITATKATGKRLLLSQLISADNPDYRTQAWKNTVKNHWDDPLFAGYDGTKIVI